MTLRIDRVRDRVRLSGAFRSEHVHQVKAELDLCTPPVVLDLEEVDLADVEAIRFFECVRGDGSFCAALFRLHQGLDVPGTRTALEQLRARRKGW